MEKEVMSETIPIVFGSPMEDDIYTVPVYEAENDSFRSTSFATSAHYGRDSMRTPNWNGSSRILLPSSQRQPLSPDARQSLRQQGYTDGLVQMLCQSNVALPLRIWVVDNSGSMSSQDGQRFITIPGNKQLQQVTCTRWKELQETVEYHAQLAALLKSPTVFRLLNDPGQLAGPSQFSVAENSDTIDDDLARAIHTMQNSHPGGVTPLLRHLREVREQVLELTPSLRATGSKVAIILATDGLPTDEQGYTNPRVTNEFETVLRSLEGLPVWIVVRLCTDDDQVVQYWNNLDNNLELSLEVLDDFVSEAKEIYPLNPWLNYGLPLHRMREMGCHDRLVDLLDERKFTTSELYSFCQFLFGKERMKHVPEPDMDWKSFIVGITALNNKEDKQWNPMSKRMEPWIDLKKLKWAYGTGLSRFI